MLHLKLNNGLQFYAPPDTENSKWWNNYRKAGRADEMTKFLIFKAAYLKLVNQFIKGIYERNYQLQGGDTVIDVGAAWGFNTVGFSQKVGNKGRVVAIEPDKDSLVILRKNIEANRCRNVTVVEKGLWSKKTKMKFWLNEYPGTSSLVTQREEFIETTEIEVDTLDNILEELGIGKVALIKMDIEGAEIEALKGMGRVLSNNNNVKVVVASYHIVDGQPTYKTITPMMKRMGFDSQFNGEISYFAKQ